MLNKQDPLMLKSVKNKIIGLGFTQDQFSLSNLVSVFLSKRENHKIAMAKSKDIIYKLLANKYHLVIEGRTA